MDRRRASAILCGRDPQVTKALEAMPEADQLLKRKRLSLQPPAKPDQLAAKS